MTVTCTPHSLYCSNCHTAKRIFLSTHEQEIQAFKEFHEECPLTPPETKDDPRFSLHAMRKDPSPP